MIRVLFLLVTFLIFNSCTDSKKNTVFQSVEIKPIYKDSISIRAIDIVGNTLRYAANKGVFGNIDLVTGKVMEGIQKYHNSIPAFRAISHTSTDF